MQPLDKLPAIGAKPPFEWCGIIDMTKTLKRKRRNHDARAGDPGSADRPLRVTGSPIGFQTFVNRGEVVLADKKKSLPHQNDGLTAVRTRLAEATVAVYWDPKDT